MNLPRVCHRKGEDTLSEGIYKDKDMYEEMEEPAHVCVIVMILR
jgi:hypothetical protein